MNKKYTKFDIFVITLVTLTGTGFGVLTGLAYSYCFWWVGGVAGCITSFFLSKWFLKNLQKFDLQHNNEGLKWFLGTLFGAYCGFICAAAVHLVMIVAIYSIGPSDESAWGNIGTILPLIGTMIGACAGFIVGGICSLLYLFVDL